MSLRRLEEEARRTRLALVEAELAYSDERERSGLANWAAVEGMEQARVACGRAARRLFEAREELRQARQARLGVGPMRVIA